MLKDVIAFVSSRSGESNRDILLREINFAWTEYWNSTDLENSLFEVTVQPATSLARVTVPYYVDKIRAVKHNYGGARVQLNTPRPYYQDQTFAQSPWTWRILGVTPLKQSITNATQLSVSIPEAETARFVVTLQGPTDNSSSDREQLTFDIGDITQSTTKNFTDLVSITKNLVTSQDVSVTAADGTDLATIPNRLFQAKNTVLQIVDKYSQPCTTSLCFDILYKAPCPYLYYDEDVIPMEEVLMSKTLEWMTMPKEGQEAVTAGYASKASSLLVQFNTSEARGIEHRLDLGQNPYTTQYRGHL